MNRPTIRPLMLDRWVHTMNDNIARLVAPHFDATYQHAYLTQAILSAHDATGLPLDRCRAIVLASLDQELSRVWAANDDIRQRIFDLTASVEDAALEMAGQVLKTARLTDSDSSY